MATISEVARLLDVDRDTVKAWTREFAEHLTLAAQPPKGRERQFGELDLRVLGLVAELWEDEPDLEYIHDLLNSGVQHEERFLEFGRLHTTIFQDMPDEIDETWQHGVLIGGMAMRELPQVARAYKTAADELVESALSKHEPHEIDYPIIFLYRHSIELYLKAMLDKPPDTHDLKTLIGLLEKQIGKAIAPWIAERVRDFHEIDQMSDMFRYAELPSALELWIDLPQLNTVMDRLAAAFEQHIHMTPIAANIQDTPA